MSTTARILDMLLLLMLMLSGFGSYGLLSMFGTLYHPFNLVIAASVRIVTLLFYRFYAKAPDTPMRLLFEWIIPVISIAELVLLICVFPIEGESFDY